MLRFICVAALACAVTGHARAGEFAYRYSAETGVEYASGLRHDHDQTFSTPPKRRADFRYTYALSAGATYTTDVFEFDLSYTFDQRTYNDYNLFHRRRHDAIFNVSGDIFWNIGLALRYRYRRSLPEGVLGSIESDQIRVRATFPEFIYAPAQVRVRPSAYSLWQSTDFHKLRFLDANSWESGFETVFTPLSDNWQARLSVAHGIWDARAVFPSNNYVDVAFELTSGQQTFFNESWVGGVGLELDLGYREEWYEGLTSDVGGQRRDRVSSVEVTARRPWTNRISSFGRAGFDDHESNWADEDFDEIQVIVGVRYDF